MVIELTDKKFWDTNWNKTALQGVLREYSPYKFCRFHYLIKKHLPHADKGQKFLEVGCVPGRHLVYFSKEYGYHVEGVDFSDHIELVHDVMEYHSIKGYNLYEQDFLQFDNDQYDVVASFGFLEHFTNWRQMLAKHMEMTAPGGYLIISVPNLKYFQYILHKMLDPEFEQEQVVESTDLALIKEVLARDGFDILHSGYYQTFHFFCHHRKEKRVFWRRICISFFLVIGALFTRLKINLPSKWFSPQVVCIARNGRT